MLEEATESYRVAVTKALLGKFHMERQEGDVVEAGFI
jgi:xanthine dehydrogenase iron-sulfur cluster and FAD-binding subunit A